MCTLHRRVLVACIIHPMFVVGFCIPTGDVVMVSMRALHAKKTQELGHYWRFQKDQTKFPKTCYWYVGEARKKLRHFPKRRQNFLSRNTAHLASFWILASFWGVIISQTYPLRVCDVCRLHYSLLCTYCTCTHVCMHMYCVLHACSGRGVHSTCKSSSISTISHS